MTETITLFIASAPAAEPLRETLDSHLCIVQRAGLLTLWHVQHILPAQQWEQAIIRALHEAQMILPQVRPSTGGYTRAMERSWRREASVVPIILRPVDWTYEPLSTLRAFPSGGKPVVCWSHQNEAFLFVGEGGPCHRRRPVSGRPHISKTQDRQQEYIPDPGKAEPWGSHRQPLSCSWKEQRRPR